MLFIVVPIKYQCCFRMSPLGRDDALHLFPQRRNPGLSPCGGMGGEESLAGLPGDRCPVDGLMMFDVRYPEMTHRLLWKNNAHV